MAHWNKKQEILKEEHFEKDVLQNTDEEYYIFKLCTGLGIIDMEWSEYEKYLIEGRKEFIKSVEELATLPN